MKGDKQDPESPAPVDWERMHRHLLGDLAPDEFHRLEQDLLASRETRARFLEVVRADVGLHEEAMRRSDDVINETGRPRWLPWVAVAAVLVVVSVTLWQGVGPGRLEVTQVAQIPAVKPFATLMDSRDCRWNPPSAMAVEQRLSAGVIELEAGVAILDFDGGARVALTGPALFELLGPKSARLHHGDVTVRCEEGLYSFSLLTPTSTIMDLGTEFGVAVGNDGAAEVHVLAGEVEVADAVGKEFQGTMFLHAGETVLLTSDGENQSLPASTRNWMRDYSTPADREAKAVPPRVIARDVFPADLTVEKRFALGTGWQGAWWQATRGPKGDHRFVPLPPLVKRDGNAGMALLVGGGVEVRRTLAEAIDPTGAGTCYVGFSLHRMNPTQRDKSGKLSEGMVLFRSSKDPTSMLGMGLSGRHHWVVTEPGGWERSEIPVKESGPFFVVVKVEFDPRRGNRVSMTGFEDIAGVPSEEPTQWEFVTRRQLAKTTVPFDVIALQARQSPFKFGEFTLGNSWQAVVNPSSVDR